MDISTILAITNFGFSLFKKSGPNPMDSLVEMFKTINTKLNIIDEKVDIIHEKLFKLPDEIKDGDTIKSIQEQFVLTELYYNQFNSFKLKSRSDSIAKKKFLEEYEDKVNNVIELIYSKVGVLTNYSDPISINLICLSVKIDIELSKLIDRRSFFLKNTIGEYRKILIKSIFDSKNNLKDEINRLSNEIDDIYAFKYIEYRTINIYKQGRYKLHSSRVVSYLNQPIFTKKDLDDEVSFVYNYLIENGKNDKIYYRFKNLETSKIISIEDADKIKIDKYVIKTRSTYERVFYGDELIKEEYTHKAYPYSRTIYKNEKYFSDLYDENVNQYVLKSIAFINAIDTINDINQIIPYNNV